MRVISFVAAIVLATFTAPALSEVEGQNPPVGAVQNPPAGTPAPGQRGGGGRRTIQVLSLSTPAWPDGGQIPVKHSQAGAELSPALTWTAGPATTQGYLLIVHDIDVAIGNGTDDVLHWMMWNIPATTTSLSEGVAQGPELSDGSRQISATGPYYRGPAAPASGPAHHYVFELFALDAKLEVPAVGASPAATRAAVVAAAAGHIVGKGTLVGLFRRAGV